MNINSTIIELTIPGRPVPKGRPRFGRYGSVRTPMATVDHEERIKNAFFAKYGNIRLPGDLKVYASFYFKKNNHGDIDNLVKTVLDGLSKVFNDRQVKQIRSTIWITPARDEQTDITVLPFEV